MWNTRVLPEVNGNSSCCASSVSSLGCPSFKTGCFFETFFDIAWARGSREGLAGASAGRNGGDRLNFLGLTCDV